jgi:hypothetical protein
MAYWRLFVPSCLGNVPAAALADARPRAAGAPNSAGESVGARRVCPRAGHYHRSRPSGRRPKLAVSECLGQLKGASSHAVNRWAAPFRWQEGYGALTLCDEILPTVIAYVRNQKQHHHQGTIDMRFERNTHDDQRCAL